MLAVFMSLNGILGGIASLRYEHGVIAARDEADAVDMVWVTLIASFAYAAAAGIVVWLIGDAFTRWIDTPALAPMLWLLPPTLLAVAIGTILEHWSMRRGTWDQRCGAHRAVRQPGAAAGRLRPRRPQGVRAAGRLRPRLRAPVRAVPPRPAGRRPARARFVPCAAVLAAGPRALAPCGARDPGPLAPERRAAPARDPARRPLRSGHRRPVRAGAAPPRHAGAPAQPRCEPGVPGRGRHARPPGGPTPVPPHHAPLPPARQPRHGADPARRSAALRPRVRGALAGRRSHGASARGRASSPASSSCRSRRP